MISEFLEMNPVFFSEIGVKLVKETLDLQEMKRIRDFSIESVVLIQFDFVFFEIGMMIMKHLRTSICILSYTHVWSLISCITTPTSRSHLIL